MKYITRGKEDFKWFLGTLCLLPTALGNYKTNKNEENIIIVIVVACVIACMVAYVHLTTSDYRYNYVNIEFSYHITFVFFPLCLIVIICIFINICMCCISLLQFVCSDHVLVFRRHGEYSICQHHHLSVNQHFPQVQS